MRTDSFFLALTDTLILKNRNVITNVFGKREAANLKSLQVFVLKSEDDYGSTMYHFWVTYMGVIKVADEKCWRYSFEMNDNRTKQIKKLFSKLYALIKKKYTDPYWVGNSCGFE
jgi:hypothetical protein